MGEVVGLDETALEEIQAYFRLDKRIEKLQHCISRLRKIFYDRTFTTRTESNGMEFYTVGEKIDNIVADFVDIIRENERSIEILKKRKKYFNEYLNSLPPADRHYLIHKYSKKKPPTEFDELDRQLYEEIEEINEAINYMYGFPQEIKVVSVEVNNNNLEDEFDRILEALEV